MILTAAAASAAPFAYVANLGGDEVAVIDTAIRRTLLLAIMVGIGGAAVDFLYSQLAVTGLGALLREAPTVSRWFEGVGGVVLVAYGVVVTKRPLGPVEATADASPKTAAVLAALGTGISLMLLNPATIVSWLFLAGVFLSDLGRGAALVCGLGVFAGGTAWFCLVAWLAQKGRVRLGPRAAWITRVVAVLLIGYGVFLLCRTGVAWAKLGR